MALNNLPDFSYKGGVPNELVSAYQQKVMQEEQMRMNQEALKQQKINNIKDVFTAGAGVVDNIMEFNKKKQMADAQNALTSLMSRGSQQVPGPQGSPSTQDFSKTPEYRSELQSLVTKAFPEQAGKEVSKAAFAQLNPSQQVRTGQMKLVNLRLPGQADGMPVNVDSINKRAYDLQGNDITDQLGGATPWYAPATVTTNEGVRMVPRTPGTYSATNEQAPKTGAENINQLPPKSLEILEKTKEDFYSDPSVKATLSKRGDLEMAQSAVDTENWVADATLLSNVAKGLGRDVGALSDRDLARYGASPEVIRKIKTHWSKWTKGVIPEADREDFREAIRIAREKNEFLYNAHANRYSNLARRRVPGISQKLSKEYFDAVDQQPTQQQNGIPQVGQTYNGAKVTKVTRIK